MIATSDCVELPSGVSLTSDRLADTVRGCSWPLNDSGSFILRRAGSPLDAVARELAEAHDLPPDVARFDVLRFIWTLNSLALVNIVPSGHRLRRLADWLGLTLRLAPTGALPTPITRRRRLDTGSMVRGVVSTLRASGFRVLAIATASTLVLLPPTMIVGGPGRVGALAVGLGVGTAIGVGLHEAGHAAMLRGVPSALVVRGRRTFLLHAPLAPARRSLVAVSGPAAAVAAGMALVLLGAAHAEPSVVVLGLPLAAHSLSLTVLGGDGRAACGI
ncbi:MAG: PqqD family protein [Gaiella sp.]